MKYLYRDENSDQSGFALVAVLSLMLLISLLASIAFQHVQQERFTISQLISRDGVFQDAEKRLHECSRGVDVLMPTISTIGCCLIEKSSPSSLYSYFRVSIHVVDSNAQTSSQSRQQQLIRIKINPSTKQIENREFLSWREIIDPIWDKELDQSNNKPWELITPCQWTRENIL